MNPDLEILSSPAGLDLYESHHQSNLSPALVSFSAPAQPVLTSYYLNSTSSNPQTAAQTSHIDYLEPEPDPATNPAHKLPTFSAHAAHEHQKSQAAPEFIVHAKPLAVSTDFPSIAESMGRSSAAAINREPAPGTLVWSRTVVSNNAAHVNDSLNAGLHTPNPMNYAAPVLGMKHVQINNNMEGLQHCNQSSSSLSFLDKLRAPEKIRGPVAFDHSKI